MSVLFICTGNFYRSRFAEIYYNHKCVDQPDKASSRGFEVFRARNEGPVSPHTLRYLRILDIPQNTLRFPVQLTENDLLTADQVVLMDATEHVPMLQKYFPKSNIKKITLWSFRDVEFDTPEVVLPAIREAVDQMLVKTC